jgi:hypothetical protein
MRKSARVGDSKMTTTKSKPSVASASGATQQFISRRALCARWEKSAMSLRRMEKAGILRSYRIGRDARYLMRDLLALEASWEIAL